MRTRAASFSRLLRSAYIASLVTGTVVALAGGFPAGSYISGPYTLKFERNGTFRVTKSGVALVEGAYRVKGDQLQFTDKRGPFACAGKGQATGTYGWTVEAEMLRLSKVEDSCTDRAHSFADPWKKK
jgi:hypothetical protein